jgi:hypothetical protein
MIKSGSIKSVSIIYRYLGFEIMEGETFSENPELTNFDLETVSCRYRFNFQFQFQLNNLSLYRFNFQFQFQLNNFSLPLKVSHNTGRCKRR